MFGGNFPPRNWAYCDGALLAISQNQALFSILGTTYGGDGRTTFGLPDLRGRSPIGPRTGPGLPTYNLGARGGDYQNILTVNQLASHTHTGAMKVSSASAEENSPPAGGAIAGGQSIFNEETPNIALSNSSVETAATGGNVPVNNMQPYLAVNYIIALFGVFPSRN